jgi:hypothetical protein
MEDSASGHSRPLTTPIRPAHPSGIAPSVRCLGGSCTAYATSMITVRAGCALPPVTRLRVCAPEVFVHPFRSNPYTRSGVFVHLVWGACRAGVR